jgi:hypothetical protein
MIFLRYGMKTEKIGWSKMLLWGMFGVALALGLLFVGCDNGDGGGTGGGGGGGVTIPTELLGKWTSPDTDSEYFVFTAPDQFEVAGFLSFKDPVVSIQGKKIIVGIMGWVVCEDYTINTSVDPKTITMTDGNAINIIDWVWSAD